MPYSLSASVPFDKSWSRPHLVGGSSSPRLQQLLELEPFWSHSKCSTLLRALRIPTRGTMHAARAGMVVQRPDGRRQSALVSSVVAARYAVMASSRVRRVNGIRRRTCVTILIRGPPGGMFIPYFAFLSNFTLSMRTSCKLLPSSQVFPWIFTPPLR